MSTTPVLLADLLPQIKPDAPQTLPADLSGANDVESSPWYVKALAGFAAWLAAFFLGLFLGVANLIDSAESTLVAGAILTVIAVALKWFTRRSIFWGQLTFAVILAGQALLIGGVMWQREDVTTTALFTLGLELLILMLYPDALHRMLSVLAMSGALTVVLYAQEQGEYVHLLTFGLAVGVALVWQQEFRLLASRWSSLRAPLGYGLALSLFGLCLLALTPDWGAKLWWLSAAGLAIVLLYLAFTLLREVEQPLFGAVGLWSLGAVALLLVPAYQTPGILAAIIVLLLGYWRGNTLLMGLATAFLLFFLSVYYYNLEITLLNKSYILLGTGAVLLVLRFLFHRVAGQPQEQGE
ncbi:MAG: DUF4401 domain-containing protein [Caldilineaceae bacterium]|nr:DUF4401 domain-containing protein [Caldilineaceae bacterium]